MGRGVQAAVASQARATDAAVDPGAGVVDAVGLRRRAEVEDRATVLFCAWLAWSRFRVVVPLRDKTLPIGGDRAWIGRCACSGVCPDLRV